MRWILVFLWLITVSAQAQDPGVSYSFMHLDIKSGLASNHVSAIMQDKKGFIWIASTALQRYDGHNLVTVASFDKVPGSIYYDDICLCEDNQGRIWMGAPDNIRYYDPASAKLKILKTDIFPAVQGNLNCSQIVQDHAGKIWITTQEGLLEYDEQRETFIKPANVPEVLRREMYSAIIEDDEQQLWISGRNGIYMLDAQRKNLYSATNNPQKNPLLSVVGSARKFYIDERHRLWVSVRAAQSLYCYDKGALTCYMKNNRITDIMADKDHYIWVSTEESGIYRFDDSTKKFTTHIVSDNNDETGLHYAYEVNCFLNDRDGYLWIGTDEGVNILSLPDKSFRTMDYNTPGLPKAEVTGLFQDSKGYIYAGYWGKGFSWMTPSMTVKKQFSHDQQLPEERGLVWSFAEMPDGKVLIGQENGWLSVFDQTKGTFSAHHKSPLFGDQTSMTMKVESDTAVWVGLYKKGLARWNPKRDEFYYYPALTAYLKRPITVMDIALQHDSLLWLSTSDAGLIRFNRLTQTVSSATIFHIDKLAISNITCLDLLNDTTLVAGTDHGLWLYDTRNGNLRPLKINGALFDEWVLSMQPDGKNGIWFTTQYGFYRFNASSFTLSTFVQSGDIIDNNRKVRRCIERLKDGRLMVGASDHFVIFDPATLKLAPPPPDVTIISFRTMDSTVHMAAAKPVTLSYRQNFISIEFKSLQYHHEAIRYLYQLEGVDEEWVKAENMLVARYTNLPPGNYTFRVRSVNTAGTFSQGITELRIHILPAFWQTAWFKLLGALLIIVLIYLYFRMRIFYIKRAARRRTVIQQQMAQLEMKALRAQMNPHFIFNALNSIQTFMMKNETEQALSYLSRFARLIRNVLDTSQLNIIPVSKEVKMLENYLELEKLRFADQFSYEITIDDELDPDYTDIPTMVLQPFVENAIWHGLLHKKEKGNVTIAFHKVKDRVLCIIMDDGIGRTGSAALRQQSAHNSRGLQITRDRLALYNKRFNLDATFDIEDLYDGEGMPCGTRVNVWLPLGEA
jgi:ligand-binding sensor domain-containing protein